MNKTAVMSARVSPELKARTEKLFNSLGLTVSEAFNLFLNQADLRQGLPFAVEIPNAETLKAIEEGRAGIDLHKVKDVDELFAELEKIVREIEYSGKFQKDFKRMKKRGVELEKLRAVVGKLRNGEELDPHYQDHLLLGRNDPERECHITPDWLLIYAIEGDKVRLIRTGTHSDLFK